MARAKVEPVTVIFSDNTTIRFTRSEGAFHAPRPNDKPCDDAPRGLGGMLKSLLPGGRRHAVR